MFGVAGGNADFVIRCVRASRHIYLSRPGQFANGEGGQMVIRTSTGLRSLPVVNNGETPPYVSADLSAGDPQLDAMAFSRGKFVVSVKGASDLIVPAWAEFGRVVEDCRG